MRSVTNAGGFIFFHFLLSILVAGPMILIFARAVIRCRWNVSVQIERIEGKHRARSLCYRRIQMLNADDPSVDHFSEPALKEFADTSSISKGWRVLVEDEGGKLDLKQLRHEDDRIRDVFEESARSLLKRLDVPEGLSTRFLREAVKLSGASAALDDLAVVNQLKSERGIELTQFFTLHSQGRININTAPAAVLEVLLDREEPHLVKDILNLRKRFGIKSLALLGRLHPDRQKLLDVRSSFFRIRIRKAPGAGMEALNVIVERSMGELKIRRWVER